LERHVDSKRHKEVKGIFLLSLTIELLPTHQSTLRQLCPDIPFPGSDSRSCARDPARSVDVMM
jgi:hypothetical protein